MINNILQAGLQRVLSDDSQQKQNWLKDARIFS